MSRARGFTLTELAIVMTIVALLLGGLIYTLAAQVEQRNLEEARRRLEQARELLLSFALVNSRLPCPGVATGDEAGGGVAACTTAYGGFLPARAIGFQPTDNAGFGLDPWGNRIRYAVSSTTWTWDAGVTTNRFTSQHIASGVNRWDVTRVPADLVVCSQSPAVIAQPTCDANTSVTNQNVAVAIIFSTGKNGATGGTGTNEARNLDNNQLFVHRPPDPPNAPSGGGEFDDQMAWIPIGVLYGKLISAGVLP